MAFLTTGMRYRGMSSPQRVTSKGPVDLAASGFSAVWGKTSPFFCPHTKRSTGGPYDPLVLRLRAPYEGGTADYYTARDHSCAFKILVKPLKERNVLVTWEDRERYRRDQHDDSDEEDEDRSQPSSQSSTSSALYSSPSYTSSTVTSPPSSQSMSSTSSSSSIISQLRVAAMAVPSQRYTRQNYSTGGRLAPVPIGQATSVANTIHVKSFFRDAVAVARKISDVGLMDYIEAIHASDILEEDPTSHPAWDMSNPHSVLHVYDSRIYPGCLNRTYYFLDFLYKPLGQVIRELNNVLGVPYADYANLVRCTRLCEGCNNHFSFYGYNDHIKEGVCSNHPDLKQVEKVDIDALIPEFRFRSFRNDKRPKKVGETIDQPVGAAMMEWNSRIGVPADVWSVISTAIVHCTDCDLTRSFPAHLLHLTNNSCTDPGQEPFPNSPE
ncbi:hypothetical protein C8F04DRAFT_1147542 [Mycena alexandri]|uniref:Uncharacterized protein n=1 Tax=Mycena alexandri TaxID=1745969 RepID=A0AAD6WKN1_9AGAR|nr:hypothetical protein C8F04DRAFT_1156730 [Mycena alexandri]KAJ7019434.1 hypothetical protein C8F04DRAFT_1147542 [Mycena alexandri]